MKSPTYPSTPKQSRAWFTNHGIAIKDWCEAHELDRYIVTDLLRGRLKGTRGEAHRAAVMLGLKADPANESPEPLTAEERRAANDRRRASRRIDQLAA